MKENSQLIPATSDPSLSSLKTSPASTHASKGPCFALIAAILSTVVDSADSGDPIARLRGTEWVIGTEVVGCGER